MFWNPRWSNSVHHAGFCWRVLSPLAAPESVKTVLDWPPLPVPCGLRRLQLGKFSSSPLPLLDSLPFTWKLSVAHSVLHFCCGKSIQTWLCPICTVSAHGQSKGTHYSGLQRADLWCKPGLGTNESLLIDYFFMLSDFFVTSLLFFFQICKMTSNWEFVQNDL